MLDFLKKVLQIKWLWSIISGFYLVAYAFWVPGLFSTNLPVMISVLAVTLITGIALLADGFFRELELENGSVMPELPLKKIWKFAGAVCLLGYLLVYIPPDGRIVPHWSLDMATTVLAGLIMLAYGLPDIMDFVRTAFQKTWLWSILGGFYIMVYAMWVPGLFGSDLPVMIIVLGITVIAGLGLLADGFSGAARIDKGTEMPGLPFKRLWRFAGAALLFGYVLIYLPPYGQIMAVAHWPLDLAITVVSGLMMLGYGIFDL